MATASVTYTFTALTKAQAAQVNQNFTNVVDFLNNNTVHVDGSKSMTGALTLPNADPTNNNHAARKKYVDDLVGNADWSTWTPELYQNTLITTTATSCNYTQIGKLVIAQFYVTLGGAGTSGQPFEIRNLPVTAAHNQAAVGSYIYFDSGSTVYTGAAVGVGTSTIRFYTDGNLNGLGWTPAIAGASGDYIVGQVMYEVP